MRILIRPRLPVLALLLLAPSIPELLTGSTPVSTLVTHPAGFAVGYALDIGLYGSGALLIREAAAILRKGWASILLWGAAYGIAEEGLAVHSFFERSGPPVGPLTTYGAAYGVDWVWALGLTVFHATYSIALPILLTYLWFPSASGQRWFDRGSLGIVAAVYLAVVVALSLTVGHGPTPALLALFLGLEALLLLAGWRVPNDLLRTRPGPRTVETLGLAGAGCLEWIAWVTVLVIGPGALVPAWGAALVIVAGNGGALAVVVRSAGTDDLARSELAFAAGMLVPLFAWDVLLETAIPGILAVDALFGYLLYRLWKMIDERGPRSPTLLPLKGSGGAPGGPTV